VSSANTLVRWVNEDAFVLEVLSGFASGHIDFHLAEFNGLYYAGEGFATPEPGTLGLIGTGLLGVLTLARGRLRSR
jgi:hypothetical protein